MLKKALLIFGILILLAVLNFTVGPDMKYPAIQYDTTFDIPPITAIDSYIAEREDCYPLRPDNESRIVWYDSIPSQTEYAIVYLHGYGACGKEASPMSEDIAGKYGMNIYQARLHGHGSDVDSMMLRITPKKLMQSALEAVAIGKRIGKKVILMTTSTGGTLATGILAHDKDIVATINYSPNYEITNQSSHLLLKPMGIPLARVITGGKHHTWSPPAGADKYWTVSYRLEAARALRALINMCVTEKNISQITQPILNVAYYKNDDEKDGIISVEAIETFHESVATAAHRKRFVKLPDVAHHVMAHPLFSKDIESVRKVTEDFIEEVLGINSVAKQ